MTQPHAMRNIDFATVHDLRKLIEYSEGQVVSRSIVQMPNITVTLFAFAQGEGLSAHTAHGDALVQVLDGIAIITINGVEHTVQAGQSIVMPAGEPHALRAEQPFQMLLTVVTP